MFEEHLQHRIFALIQQYAVQHNQPGYVVGGFVRDLFLGKASDDIDIVIEGDGIALAKNISSQLAGRPTVSVFKNFGTAHFRFEGKEWEFVGARKESYNHSSRNPSVEPASIQEDQQRRDFTINAMAISLGSDFGTLVDPFGGVADLNQGLIRTPDNPMITFSDDPLRMLRAVRFAARFGFTLHHSVIEAIKTLTGRLEIVAPERIAGELNKMLESVAPDKALFLLDHCGLLQHILPELHALKGVETIRGYGHKDNFTHTLQVTANVAAKEAHLWLRWAALLHDIGKAPTKKFDRERGWTFHGHDAVGARMVRKLFKRLHLPQNEKMEYVSKLVGLHLRPIGLVADGVSDSALRRLLFDAGDDIDDVLTLAEADITSGNQQKVKQYLHNFERLRISLAETEEKDRLRNFQPPIDGQEIMEFFALQPSREVGIIKNAIKDAILDGIIHNERSEAIDFMLKTAASIGLKPVKPIH